MKIALGIIGIWLSLAAAPPTCVQAKEWTWQKPHARVLDRGDPEWAPQPSVFTSGASVRYIDYEGGQRRERRGQQRHALEAPSLGSARNGPSGRVFGRPHLCPQARRGLPRELVRAESGQPGDPIRLTSDLSWGRGEAVICGAEEVRGWHRGADRRDIPELEKVWWTDLEFAPRLVWMVGDDGMITRIPLARTPNWRVSGPDDVKSEWWHWDMKGVKPFGNLTEDGRLALGVDTAHLTEPPEYYLGGILWTEHGWVMGALY